MQSYTQFRSANKQTFKYKYSKPGTCGSQFNISDMNTAMTHSFYTAKSTTDQQICLAAIYKMCSSFHIPFRLTKRQDITVDEIHIVLALFIMMGILQKSTDCCPETIPL